MNLVSWGNNSRGQLGQGVDLEQLIFPTQTKIKIEPKCIAGGGKHTVILTTKNELLTCGDNDKGQLGKELSILVQHSFRTVCSPYKIIKVACGWDFNLGLTENMEVVGWGSNSFGQLGLPINEISHLSVPRKIFECKALEIAAGLRHSVIITLKGSVFTAGYNKKGQLGVCLSGEIPLQLDKFVQVDSIENCNGISCGEHHCIAKTKSGEFYSWGNNRYGQLGFDPKVVISTTVPTKITLTIDSPELCQLFSGWAHNCILTGSGSLLTWGRNDFGQLGEHRCDTWKPQRVKLEKKLKQIALGSHHTLALTESEELITWGWNEHGNCGNGTCENIKTPHTLKKLKGVKFIGSGAAHSFLCL